MSILDRWIKKNSAAASAPTAPVIEDPKKDDGDEDDKPKDPEAKAGEPDEDDPEKKKKEGQEMPNSNAAPDPNGTPANNAAQPATFAQISAIVPNNCPDRSNFIVKCMGENLTETATRDALTAHLLGQYAAANTRAETAAATEAKLNGHGRGAAPIPSRTSPANSEATQYAMFEKYEDLVAHFRSPDGGSMSKVDAVNKANKVRPDLREKYAGYARSN